MRDGRFIEMLMLASIQSFVIPKSFSLLLAYHRGSHMLQRSILEQNQAIDL